VALSVAQAQAHLDAWIAADLAVAASQSYTIGTRSLTRANAREIREQVAYWRRQVDQLTSGRSGVRIIRAVPRDL
jgi:hypothetical protein